MNRLSLTLATTLAALALSCAGSPAPKIPDIPTAAENAIPSIQGRAHQSPFVGRRIADVKGVVTAVLSGGRTPGFWMQDPDGDGDDRTSDGIFVATAGLELDVAVGDAVSVTGTVAEAGREGSLSVTQLVEPEVRVVSRGNALPAPVVVGLQGRRVPSRIAPQGMERFRPREAAIDFWESLEGMRVEIRDPVAVGPTSQYGDVVVLADRGAGAKIRSVRGGVVLQEHSPNPERVTLDARLSGAFPALNVGDRFEGPVVGIIDYAFNNYRLLPESPLPAPERGAIPPEVTRLRGDAAHVTIATYNVLNLSAANEERRLREVAATIVENLAAPDIVALQEIQDDSGPADDGVVTAARTFARLIEAIEAAGGPRYDYRQIDPLDNQDGGQPGGNIRVGLLFNPSRVEMVDRGSAGAEDETKVEGEGISTSLTLSPGRVDPGNACFAGGGEGELAEPTRKSLAAELRFDDRPLFVVVNHFRSKRGDDGFFGPTQPPVRHTEAQRTCQAEVVGAFAAEILKRDPKAAVVVLGDMNEHEYRKPMARLAETSGLTNLVDRIVVADRYTFIFEGNSQVLDHILVSPSLATGAQLDIVHVNVDRAASEAASDHDPVLARLQM